MGRTRRGVVAVATAVLVLAVLLSACSDDDDGDSDGDGGGSGGSGPSTAPPFAGIGDTYYPLDGNAGIDVARYRIRDTYDFASGTLAGTTTLTITATERLEQFSLDFLLPVSRVALSTGAATYSQDLEHELGVSPERPIPAGTKFRVTVTYAGVPSDKTYLGEGAWHADEQEVVTIGEPHIAPWWFPANDHPTDKALMDISITVPTGNTVISNGELVSEETTGEDTTFRWRAAEPMAAYLAFFAAGRFTVTSGETTDGIAWVNAVSQQGTPLQQQASSEMLARTPEYVAWLSSRLGDYPFAQTGGVVSALDVGFSLETQTRPVYGDHVTQDSTMLLVHELAHQWFGDSVSLEQWQDIWLNEGFASFMMWAYDEEHGGRSAQDWLMGAYRSHGARAPFWALPIGEPDPEELFPGQVYERGAMTLQALRNRIGDDEFWTVLRTWAEEHRFGNATIAEFVALAEQTSGDSLGEFFAAWLGEGRPEETPANGLSAR